ncbi:MAG TPA: FadR/GntR family transcriptional regulator [Acidimicrobiia bacterium]
MNLLRKLIAQGDLRPGQRLPNEHDLANRLGISRASLREGIRALAAMNIVVVRHGDGTYVSSLEPELLAEPLQLILAIEDSAVFSLFEVRRITEPAAAALAAERATTEELDALRDEIKAGIEAQGDALKLVEHDSRLHQLIHLAAHNPILRSVSASLAGLANSVRKRTVRLPRNAPLTISEHTDVVEAICARDSEAASRAMTVHLVRVENDLRAYPAAGSPNEAETE